jgi:uncharacterized membrane protein
MMASMRFVDKRAVQAGVTTIFLITGALWGFKVIAPLVVVIVAVVVIVLGTVVLQVGENNAPR